MYTVCGFHDTHVSVDLTWRENRQSLCVWIANLSEYTLSYEGYLYLCMYALRHVRDVHIPASRTIPVA